MSTLKLDRQQAVKLPVGGEGFAATPLIGRWIAAVMYSFMTETDMNMFSGFTCDSHRKMSDWNRYYFQDYEQAKRWSDEARNRYAPRGGWVFQAMLQDIVNMTEEGREKWAEAAGDLVVYDNCQIVTPKSKKYRHELHMISLPSAVSAYARSQGWDVPEFDLHELIDPERQFTDDFQAYMIGSQDAKSQDQKDFRVAHDLAMGTLEDQAAEVVRRLVLNMSTDEFKDIPEPVIIEAKDIDYIHYEWSVLWERRTALWKLLGSDDPLPYRPAGTAAEEEKPKNEKFDAPAGSQLDEALGILAYRWDDYAWLQVASIPDPRVDAVYGDSAKRLGIPAIVKIYGSEEEARAEAAAELAARGEGGNEPSTPAATVAATAPAAAAQYPPVPEAWMAMAAVPGGSEEEAQRVWMAEVRKLKAKYPGPLPVFIEQVERAQEAGTLEKEHACAVSEAVAWFDLV